LLSGGDGGGIFHVPVKDSLNRLMLNLNHN
jgi:hypothetical protein